MASPTKVISVSIITNVPKADMTIQGAVRRELVPCFKSSPKLGVGGGSPKPKKSRNFNFWDPKMCQKAGFSLASQ